MAEMKTLTINGTTYEIKDEYARNTMKPLLLDADMASTYDAEPQYGDEALAAVIAGRQILIKTPNADGKTYNANYSPVYMYQVPNKDSDYLYLFYLKDEKQTIDLSAVGMGQFQMPLYGELQMKLSRTYTECPLK